MSDVVRDAIAASLAEITQIATTPDASGYGRDLVCINDLTERMTETDPSSTQTLAQDLYHRVVTARGTIPDDETFGIDLLEFLHKPATQEELRQMAGLVTNEITKDDRVTSAETTVVSNLGSLSVSIAVVPADPEVAAFKLIIAVTDGQTLLKEVLQ